MRKLGYHGIDQELLRRVPELTPRRPDTDVEGLPHQLFLELPAFLVDEIRAGRTGPGSAFHRSLRFLEQALDTGNLHVVNLVLRTFVDHLSPAVLERIRALAGPRLRLAVVSALRAGRIA